MSDRVQALRQMFDVPELQMLYVGALLCDRGGYAGGLTPNLAELKDDIGAAFDAEITEGGQMFNISDGPGPHQFMMPSDPMDRLLDQIRNIIPDLRPGQSICVHRAPDMPKPGEPLFTIYTQGSMTLGPGRSPQEPT